PEQHAACIVKLRVDVRKARRPGPMIAGQVHRLLRCPGAFDGHRRLREQCAALFELLSQLPGIRRQIVTVVGRHAVAAKGFAKAVDGVPVQFQPWADHQLLVADDPAVV
nr:hypothetical protein [Tanacetum cinerariifolium]